MARELSVPLKGVGFLSFATGATGATGVAIISGDSGRGVANMDSGTRVADMDPREPVSVTRAGGSETSGTSASELLGCWDRGTAEAARELLRVCTGIFAIFRERDLGIARDEGWFACSENFFTRGTTW